MFRRPEQDSALSVTEARVTALLTEAAEGLLAAWHLDERIVLTRSLAVMMLWRHDLETLLKWGGDPREGRKRGTPKGAKVGPKECPWFNAGQGVLFFNR